ncbi:MAG: hypothetical protein PHW24_00055 [Candidatus Moranbacteria bacterium]|nr:hypothetical protein [Candidatus Moranbacteria bacterium]
MKNKKGNIVAIAAIILIVAITAGVIGWMFAQKMQTPASQTVATQPTAPVIQIQSETPTAAQITPTQENSANWNSVQFDACGKKAKYEKLSWWNKFSAQIGKYNYYTDNYINSVLKSASENKYSNPKKIKYTYETFCSDENNKNSIICGDARSKKLSISDFNYYGEGCLAKDGAAFVAVFPGEYMGGGNYIFRYDINNDILESANKVNELQNGYAWFAPPTSFGKRVGNIIKMTGGSGDAGCGSSTEFDYDIVSNQVKLIKECTKCEEEKPKCETF